jgi:hypothetical protein
MYNYIMAQALHVLVWHGVVWCWLFSPAVHWAACPGPCGVLFQGTVGTEEMQTVRSTMMRRRKGSMQTMAVGRSEDIGNADAAQGVAAGARAWMVIMAEATQAMHLAETAGATVWMAKAATALSTTAAAPTPASPTAGQVLGRQRMGAKEASNMVLVGAAVHRSKACMVTMATITNVVAMRPVMQLASPVRRAKKRRKRTMQIGQQPHQSSGQLRQQASTTPTTALLLGPALWEPVLLELG